MAADPASISDPAVRALAREVASLTRQVESLKRGQRTAQLGHSSIDDGTLWVRDAQGVNRVAIGRQVDGKFGWGAVNGGPPPRPTPPTLEASAGGVTIGWDGQFVGPAPSDFVHVKAHLSPVGSAFIPSDGNCVGHLLGNAKLPITPLDPQAQYWCVLIAYNTSGAASEPSIVAGPMSPAEVVATEILDGIVTDLKLADGAVTRAKIAAGAVGTGQIGEAQVDLSRLADGSVDATKIVDGSITPVKLSFSIEDVASIATYYQPDQPTGDIPAGSLWADSDDRNRLYRWSGAGWVEMSDTGIQQALAAAQQAQTDAAAALDAAAGAEAAVDGKVTVFYQPESPSGANTGDLWLDTDDGNRLYRWSGSLWEEITDSRVQQALVNAQTAQATADGKIDAYYQDTAPESGMSVGDLWYRTDAGNLPHRWNGTAWVEMPAGEQALADGAVTETKIAGNAVVEGHITAGAVGTNQLAANSVVAGKIAADQIAATHIVAGGIETANLAADSVAAGKIAADAVTSREIKALSILADKIAANQINAGHIEAGAVTADKLSAILVLASQLIAGDPNGWRTEIGDAVTPLLYWNGVETGFALSRDPVTGQSNAYLSGRIEFGNGSQIEQDYLDLCEQPSTGFQEPKPRQYRTLIYSEPVTQATAQWMSATGKSNLLLCAVLAVNYAGTGAPTITMPAGWSLVRTATGGATGSTRLSLYHIPAAPSFHSSEVIGVSLGSSLSVQLVEYAGIAGAALDVSASASGTGTVASSGTTATTGQGAEVHVAVFGTAGAGAAGRSGFTNPTNGFSVLTEGGGFKEHGSALVVRNATGVGQASTQMTTGEVAPWIGIVATFRAALADGVPTAPPASTTRLFTLDRGGKSTPHVIDDSGAIYPVGRGPYCRVRVTVDVGLAAVNDVYAQTDWVATDDPYNMVAISSDVFTYSNITIPVTGLYHVRYRAIYQISSSSAGLAVAFVTRNGRAPQLSIAREARHYNTAGADGTPVVAAHVLPLTAGDILYWGNFSSVDATFHKWALDAEENRTEITVHYLGPL